MKKLKRLPIPAMFLIGLLMYCLTSLLLAGYMCAFGSFLMLCHNVFVGSAITGPIGKECADLWPRIASAANAIV